MYMYLFGLYLGHQNTRSYLMTIHQNSAYTLECWLSYTCATTERCRHLVLTTLPEYRCYLKQVFYSKQIDRYKNT